MKYAFSSLMLAMILVTPVAAQVHEIKEPKRIEIIPADLGHCGMFLLRQDYVVFNDQETLNKAVKGMKEYCVSAVAPKIDFEKYTLIGVGSTVGNCGAGSRMDVAFERDDEKKVFLIKVSTYDNPCRGLSYRQQWSLVPKIPADYKIEFAK